MAWSADAAHCNLSRLLALFTLVLRHCYINIEAAKTGFPRKVGASLYPLCSQEDRTYRNHKEPGSITPPSSSSPL